MKTRTKTISFILCLAAQVYSQTGLFVPELAHVDQAISNFMTKWNLPGASVAIVKDGRLVYARGFGFANKETSEVVEPQHQFRVASVSKPITAVAVMKLYDDGLIDLDDRVFGTEAILNDDIYATIKDARVLDITVRNLLQHTGGWDILGNRDPMFMHFAIANAMGVSSPPDEETIIRYMLNQALDFTPGTQQVYSNFAYVVLGKVIEKISGQTYEEYVRSEILLPLGATSLQIGKNLFENRADDEVKYYDRPTSPLAPSIYGTGMLVPEPYGGFNIEAMDSHGGWIASAIDLMRFMVAVDGFSSKTDILKPSTIQLMQTRPFPDAGFAYGWGIWGGNWWWHFGLLPGSSAYLSRMNNGISWAILFNSQSYNQNYFWDLDSVIFNAVNTVSKWPEHDLFEMTTSVDNNETTAPNSFSLAQNYPNPFNPETTISYQLPRNGHVKLLIYNTLGQVIRTLVSSFQDTGNHQVVWNGRDGLHKFVASGIYLYQIQAGSLTATKRLVLLR